MKYKGLMTRVLIVVAMLVLFFSCNIKQGDPNILIFLTDDLGYGDLGCYGNEIIQSPNIDKLADQGILFTDFHSAGTVCSPSRASLLTGRHPYRIGFYYILGGGAHLRSSEITLPSILRENGYSTFFAGKWHLTQFDRPKAEQPDPSDHGFDHWFATAVNAFDGPESPGKFWRNGEPVGELNDWYCNLIVDEAIEWMDTRENQDKPFFMEICTHGPHTPINPPKSYAEAYDNEEVEKLERQVGYGYVPRDKKDIGHNKKYYYGTVTQIDDAFGKLMSALEQKGIMDNTLVIFTSDNGPEYPVNFMESKGEWDEAIRDKCFGSPGPLRGMKRFTYEGGHRVPGIIRWPGNAPAGVSSEVLINGTDIFPTICAMLNIEIPSDRTIDGENMLEAFRGSDQLRRNPVVWSAPVHEYEFVPPMILREGDYLLVGFFNKKESGQLWMDWIKTSKPESYALYNLKEDIAQQNNIADKKPEIVKDLSAKMDQMWLDLQADSPVWPDWKAK